MDEHFKRVRYSDTVLDDPLNNNKTISFSTRTEFEGKETIYTVLCIEKYAAMKHYPSLTLLT